MEKHSNKSSALKWSLIKKIIVGLLAINILLVLYIAFIKTDALDLEVMKTGGKQNFNLVQKIYSSDAYVKQQRQSLDQALVAINQQGNTETANPSQAQTLDQAKIATLLENTYVRGNKDARFVIFEYSDLLCPFCKRHHNDQTLQKVQEKYPNDVALIFKNMPLVQLHPTAFKGAEWVECAGKLWGEKAFYAYVDKAFLADSFDDTNVVSLAKEVGVSESKFKKCIENSEFKSKIDGIITEANTVFGIWGTPGNVILDKQTGKYVVVNWAYPFEKFDSELQALMK